MTTIAYRNGVLAGDTCAMGGGWYVPFETRKVCKTRDGRLLGFSGDLTAINKLSSFLKKVPGPGGSERPELPEDCRVIEVRRDRTLLIYEDKHFFEIRAEFCAWGSGSPPANAAMHAGATAVRAVQIAKKLDPGTAGRVLWVKL